MDETNVISIANRYTAPNLLDIYRDKYILSVVTKFLVWESIMMLRILSVLLISFLVGCINTPSEDYDPAPPSTSPAPDEWAHPEPLRDGDGNAEENPPSSPWVETDTFRASVIKSFVWRNGMGNTRGLLAVFTVCVVNKTDQPLELMVEWMALRRHEEINFTGVTFAYRTHTPRSIPEKREAETITLTVMGKEKLEIEFVTRSGPKWKPNTKVQMILALISVADAAREGPFADYPTLPDTGRQGPFADYPTLTETRILQGNWVRIQAID